MLASLCTRCACGLRNLNCLFRHAHAWPIPGRPEARAGRPHVRTCMCTRTCTCTCAYTRAHACIHKFKRVRTYVCTYVTTYTCTSIDRGDVNARARTASTVGCGAASPSEGAELPPPGRGPGGGGGCPGGPPEPRSGRRGAVDDIYMSTRRATGTSTVTDTCNYTCTGTSGPEGPRPWGAVLAVTPEGPVPKEAWVNSEEP